MHRYKNDKNTQHWHTASLSFNFSTGVCRLYKDRFQSYPEMEDVFPSVLWGRWPTLHMTHLPVRLSGLSIVSWLNERSRKRWLCSRAERLTFKALLSFTSLLRSFRQALRSIKRLWLSLFHTAEGTAAADRRGDSHNQCQNVYSHTADSPGEWKSESIVWRKVLLHI